MTTHSNSHYEPGSDLPSPEFETPATNLPELNIDKPRKKAEEASEAAELPQTSQASDPQAIIAAIPTEPPIFPADQPVATTSSSLVDEPHVAEDNDLIEQEWVNKAKAIVEHTKEDPHAQNKEINKFKAGYIKKRYNKEIKVSED